MRNLLNFLADAMNNFNISHNRKIIMHNKLVHGSVLLVFVLYTTYWLIINKPSSKLHKLITITLILKVFFSAFVFIEEFFNTSEIIVLKIILSHLYPTCLYYVFMQIGQGWFLSLHSSIWLNCICICLVNLSLLGYVFDTYTFGPIVVVSEGLVFLFIVKKTLEALEKLYIYQRNNSELMIFIKKYSIFLMMIYLFFVGEMVRVCLIGVYNRYRVEKESLFWIILTAVYSFVTSISVMIIFLQFMKCERVFLYKKIQVLQAITDRCNIDVQDYALVEMPGLNRTFFVGSKM